MLIDYSDGSYQTPNGVVNGIQWVPAEPSVGQSVSTIHCKPQYKSINTFRYRIFLVAMGIKMKETLFKIGRSKFSLSYLYFLRIHFNAGNEPKKRKGNKKKRKPSAFVIRMAIIPTMNSTWRENVMHNLL